MAEPRIQIPGNLIRDLEIFYELLKEEHQRTAKEHVLLRDARHAYNSVLAWRFNNTKGHPLNLLELPELPPSFQQRERVLNHISHLLQRIEEARTAYKLQRIDQTKNTQ